MASDTPIACSLGAAELPARLAEIRSIGRSSLLSADEDGELRFRDDPETRARLAAIVEAESRCCSFLRFELTERDGELLLRIDAPDEARPIARELSRAFAADSEAEPHGSP